MTNNEKELINIIREHDNPEQAVEIAIKLIFEFLDEREVLQCTSSAPPRITA